MGRKKGGTNDRYDTDPSTVSKSLDFLIKLTAWKNQEKLDLHDPEAVKERVEQFFLVCSRQGHRPTLQDFAIALNLKDRDRVTEIVTGKHYPGSRLAKIPTASAEFIRDGYAIILGNIEGLLIDGNINPIAGIFLAKNMGIKDTNSYFDKEPEKDKVSIEDLRTKYLGLLPQQAQNQDPMKA